MDEAQHYDGRIVGVYIYLNKYLSMKLMVNLSAFRVTAIISFFQVSMESLHNIFYEKC